MAIVIHTIQSLALRPIAHVRIEVLERTPTRTDPHSTTAVASIIRRAGIGTAPDHGIPSFIGSGAAHSVPAIGQTSTPTDITLPTSTALGMA